MYWIKVINGYITAIGTGKGNEEITETQYNAILSMLRSHPTAPEGWAYRLTESLEWELYELPAVEETDDEISGDELLSMIEEVL